MDTGQSMANIRSVLPAINPVGYNIIVNINITKLLVAKFLNGSNPCPLSIITKRIAIANKISRAGKPFIRLLTPETKVNTLVLLPAEVIFVKL